MWCLFGRFPFGAGFLCRFFPLRSGGFLEYPQLTAYAHTLTSPPPLSPLRWGPSNWLEAAWCPHPQCIQSSWLSMSSTASGAPHATCLARTSCRATMRARAWATATQVHLSIKSEREIRREEDGVISDEDADVGQPPQTTLAKHIEPRKAPRTRRSCRKEHRGLRRRTMLDNG